MARGVKSESVLKIPEELSDLCLDIISDDYGRNVRIFPLDYLNQKSFSTLSRLELKITFTIERDEDPVLDPYLGFCKTTVVRHLTSLTHLKFDIRFQGSPSTVDLLSTGPEWGRLDEVLVSDRALPLNELSIQLSRRHLSMGSGMDRAHRRS